MLMCVIRLLTIVGLILAAGPSLLAGDSPDSAAPTSSVTADASMPASDLHFETDVRPILKAMCFQCHGEEPELQGGLDLRLVRLMAQGGDSGESLVPGDADASLLWQRVESDEMPEGEKKLSDQEKATLRRWIEQGSRTLRPEPENVEDAKYTPEELAFWAFQPVRRPPVPQPAGWEIATPIDGFIAEKLQEADLTFSPQADRRTLIRRLSYDLTGLPPTPEQIDAFLNDRSPEAYARLVDSLLASPQYGVRWGRHWLDVAGYAETDGNLNKDRPREHAWRYRDYVIDAFNADKPYDRFLTEQIAGDELIDGKPDPDNPTHLELLTATGLLRMGPDVTATSNTLVDRNQAVADMVNIVSSATLGLTIACAQCHDHRYDPISAEDYYRYRAIFDPALPLNAWTRPDDRLVDMTPAEINAQRDAIEQQAKEIEAEINDRKRQLAEEVYARLMQEVAEDDREPLDAALNKAVKDRSDEERQLVARYPMLHPVLTIQRRLNLFEPAKNREFAEELKEVEAVRATKPPRTLVMAVQESGGNLPTSAVFFRGDPEQPADTVEPGEIFVVARSRPEFKIAPDDASRPSSGRRLTYAQYLTDGQHPLTARVAVNRLWAHQFGRGLVATPGDFGFFGERPSHPELLDWLADELVRGGWQIKRLHRLMVMSRTYRQSSTRTAAQDAIDPENRLLARMSLRRLDAEATRDAMLFASDLFVAQLGGPSVPVGPDLQGRAVIGLAQIRAGLPAGVADVGDQKYRRSVYLQAQRLLPLSLLETFDLPAMEPNCNSRKSSTVATQSLLMLNDESIIDVSAGFARRAANSGQAPREQIHELFVRLFAKEPSEQQTALCLEFLEAQTEHFRQDTEKAWQAELKKNPAAAQQRAFAALAQSLLATNRFLYLE